jgi:arsenate reductase
METTPNVLFLCTGNSCRSQMAEGFLHELAGDRFGVYSAGIDPADRIHPMAIDVMGEKGIDISHQEPKNVSKYLGRLPVRHLVIVCDQANEKCPRVFPGVLNRMFWPFDDPATSNSVDTFRAVRDQIEARIKSWLAEIR